MSLEDTMPAAASPSSNVSDVEQLAIAAIRTLSMDAVQAANSGHPGTPMALAPVAYAVWQNFLRFDPADPTWLARDRFVLSCGHASMLLYSLLHLAEVRQADHYGDVVDEPAVPLDHLRQFRQLHGRCPGHPEFGETGGVETTTGPLGQGCGNSVGMAIAQKWLAARYNKPGFELFNGNVFVLCSDGDLMEGVASEAASLAGHLKLSNLCWIYDDNRITIEGDTQLAFTENVALRFKGYGWNVLRVDDANDLPALQKAIKRFTRTKNMPTLVIVRSHIGWGSPNKQDSHKAHGEPLGEEEIRLTKQVYGWTFDKFYVPAEVYDHFRKGVGARGAKLHKAWNRKLRAYAKDYPAEAAEIKALITRDLPADWESAIPTFPADVKGLATRASSGKVLNAVAQKIPWLVGGSADLAPSTNTLLTFDGAGGDFEADNYAGRNFHWGIREHGMAAALNGMMLCGVRPYGATFFCFTDYMRPSMRLSALMRLPVLYVLTHDSIGLGEDGPTHQPVEHLAAMRAIPGLVVIRPGDANETAEAYRAALRTNDKPTALVLTRQNIPTLDRTKYASAAGVACGGYVLAGAENPEVILIGTGSELQLVVAAYEKLSAEGVRARVVSMPSWELFEAQDEGYRESVLPPDVTARVVCEAGVEQGWQRYLGPKGRFVGMTGFGASAPAAALYKHFGITADRVVEEARLAMKA